MENSKERKFYNPNTISYLVLQSLGLELTLEELKVRIENMKVVVTPTQIQEYLNQLFQEQTKKMNQEQPKSKSETFAQKLLSKKYQLEPYTFQYFETYMDVLKRKSFLFIELIETLQKKSCTEETILELDLHLDSDGNILQEDVIRILEPTLHNIRELQKVVNQANDLSTYAHLHLSKDNLYRIGLSEDVLYPKISLQLKETTLENDVLGYIPLSESQKQQLKNRELDNYTRVLKLIENL